MENCDHRTWIGSGVWRIQEILLGDETYLSIDKFRRNLIKDPAVAGFINVAVELLHPVHVLFAVHACGFSAYGLGNGLALVWFFIVF